MAQELVLLSWAGMRGVVSLATALALPLTLPNGQSRTYLEDGDAVVLRGWCEKPGAARIGFGECIGTVLPARA